MAGELIPVSNPVTNGLLDKRFAKSMIHIQNKKAVLIHESIPKEHHAILIKIALLGAGGQNADCIALISCHTRLKRASVSTLWGNMAFQIYVDFRTDNAVKIYLVESREGQFFADHTIIKEPYLIDDSNKGMEVLDNIDVDALQLVSISKA